MITRCKIFSLKFGVHQGRKDVLRLGTWSQPSRHCTALQYLHPCWVQLFRSSVLMLTYLVTTHTYIHTINTSIYALAGGGYYLLYKSSIYTRMVTKKNRHDTSDFIVATVKFYYNNGHRH